MSPKVSQLSTLMLIVSVCSLIFTSSTASISMNQLSGVSKDNMVYSGLIPISDSSEDQLFFTFYGKDGITDSSKLKDSPLVIAVGSPGSSAQYLNLGIMGPITLNSDMTTKTNQNSLTSTSNVMFIDLLGTGFSFAASTDSLPQKYEDYGVQLTYAINKFVKESEIGGSSTVVLVGEGPFIRALPGLDDIDALSGIVHFGAWPELYAVGKYYGVAGKDMGIFGDSERFAIESTFISCYNDLNKKAYKDAHSCYDSILSFVETKTKNTNLFDTSLGYNLTEHLPMIQYYFSQASTVSLFKAPNARMFETQSNWISSKTYEDLATNKTSDLSAFMKDYLSVRHYFISGDKDYIAYKQSLKAWLENELNYVERAKFVSAKLEDIQIDGKVVGYTKGVKQVQYAEILSAGHFVYENQPHVVSGLIAKWVGTLDAEESNIREEDSSSYKGAELLIQ